MNCYNAERLLATRRDLDGDQARAVQTHLLGCDRCAAAWQREQRTSQLLQALPTSQAQLSPQVAVNIRARLSRPPRRWRHQFAAAIVVALCCLVFLGAVAAQSYPQAVQQTAAWLGWQGWSRSQQLYRVGIMASQEGAVYNQLVVTDPATQQETRVFDDAFDVVVSPDQTRLYLLQDDGVRAIDSQTQQELWRVVAFPNIGGTVSPLGGTQMAVSPDGRWLYFAPIPDGTFQIIDTATGELQPNSIQLPNYQDPHFVTPPDGVRLYIVDEQAIHIINTQTQQIERSVQMIDQIMDQRFQGVNLMLLVGAMLSPNGEQIYVVGPDLGLAVFDVQQQAFVGARQLPAPARIAGQGVVVAGTADGTRLVVGRNYLVEELDATGKSLGFRTPPETVSDIIVYDTRTWQPVQQIPFDRPIEKLAVDRVGSAVYAVLRSAKANDLESTQYWLGADIIVAFDIATGQVVRQDTLEGEGITRLFFGP